MCFNLRGLTSSAGKGDRKQPLQRALVMVFIPNDGHHPVGRGDDDDEVSMEGGDCMSVFS